MEHLVLCRYGELWLKSRPVMEKFYSKLISNMHKMLDREEGMTFKVMKKRNRAFVSTDNIEKTIEILQKVPGLVSVSPVIKMELNIDDIEKELLSIAETKLKGNKKTFAVKVKRVGEHEFTSKELESRWGFAVGSKYQNPVNLSHPEVALNVEVRNDTAFIFTDTYSCAGGLPVGVEGTVCALIQNDDDLLSAYLILKRGCDVVAITDNKAVAEKLIPFTPALEILEFKNDFYPEVEKAITDFSAKAFVSGEMLNSMTDIESKTELPVLRPLVGMGDEMIKELKESIF